jgi:hypothetical protein
MDLISSEFLFIISLSLKIASFKLVELFGFIFWKLKVFSLLIIDSLSVEILGVEIATFVVTSPAPVPYNYPI